MRRGIEFWKKRWDELPSGKWDAAEASDLAAHAIWKRPDHARIEQVVSRYRRVEEFITTELLKLDLKPASLLDVGTGTGHWLSFFHRQFALEFRDMLATDLVDEPLEFVSRRFAGVQTERIDLATDTLPEKVAQIGSAIGVLHHVTSEEALRFALHSLGQAVELCFIFPVYELPAPEPRHYKTYWTREQYLRACSNLVEVSARGKCLLLRSTTDG